MQVNSLNQASFSGSYKKTGIGNEYETSHECKKYFPVIAATAGGIGSALVSGSLISRNVIKEIAKELDVKPTGKSKSLVVAGMALYGASIGAFSGLLSGSIADLFVNSARRNRVDKFAKTGETPEKTNKGKIILGTMGSLGLLSVGIAASISRNHLKSLKEEFPIPKAMMLVIPLLAFANSLLSGHIYDTAVNKYVDKIAEKNPTAKKV